MPLANVKLKDDDRSNLEPSAISGISAFLGKLWKMVEDPKTDHLISWGKSGNTFVIKNQIDFAKTILPSYYKHNNIASFIRQLNMYGFHKIISTTSGSLDSSDNDEIEFTHPCFVRGHSYLLEQIKRKMNNPKENFVKNENGNQYNESIKRVLNDIKNLKGKQEYLGNQLCAVKQENEILWRELSLLRQKHASQQSVLNKLIRFLVSLAQPSNHSLVKRRLVPMLQDAASNSKQKSSSYYEGDHVYSVKKPEANSPGPTIHEIHTSELPENVQIIETPVMEVTVDDSSPIMIENEIVSCPSPGVSNPEVSIDSPEPVPAALLLPSKMGSKKLRTVYLAPGQQIPSHYLISQSTNSSRSSPEYLIPERTDNPLMELVHETESDDNNEYITIMTSDGTDLVDNNIIAEDSSDSFLSNKTNLNKKKTPGRRRIKKEDIPAPVNVKPATPKKIERKKKPTTASKESVENTSVNSDDFLFDLSLNNEPLIEIHSPSSSASPKQEKNRNFLKIVNNQEPKSEIPICVEDMISIPQTTPDIDTLDVPVNTQNVQIESMLMPNNSTIGSPVTKNSEDIPSVFSNSAVNTESDKTTEDAIIKRINECIDNAQNMKIACSDSSIPPTKSYVNDISMQLDNMQSDINSLKELIQSEGLTLDVNTLLDIFNQDPYSYNMPPENSENFHKLEDEKIDGNELISSAPTMFDFTDIFAQNEWSQPSTPLSSAMDTDYCSLNTPQIERTLEETISNNAPPTKKIKQS